MSEERPWIAKRLDAMDRGDVAGARDVVMFFMSRLTSASMPALTPLPPDVQFQIEVLAKEAEGTGNFLSGYAAAMAAAKKPRKRKKRA